jgi:hypothetical protein
MCLSSAAVRFCLRSKGCGSFLSRPFRLILLWRERPALRTRLRDCRTVGAPDGSTFAFE